MSNEEFRDAVMKSFIPLSEKDQRALLFMFVNSIIKLDGDYEKFEEENQNGNFDVELSSISAQLATYNFLVRMFTKTEAEIDDPSLPDARGYILNQIRKAYESYLELDFKEARQA